MLLLQEDQGVQVGQVDEADLEVGDLPEKNKLKCKKVGSFFVVYISHFTIMRNIVASDGIVFCEQEERSIPGAPLGGESNTELLGAEGTGAVAIMEENMTKQGH